MTGSGSGARRGRGTGFGAGGGSAGAIWNGSWPGAGTPAGGLAERNGSSCATAGCPTNANTPIRIAARRCMAAASITRAATGARNRRWPDRAARRTAGPTTAPTPARHSSPTTRPNLAGSDRKVDSGRPVCLWLLFEVKIQMTDAGSRNHLADEHATPDASGQHRAAVTRICHDGAIIVDRPGYQARALVRQLIAPDRQGWGKRCLRTVSRRIDRARYLAGIDAVKAWRGRSRRDLHYRHRRQLIRFGLRGGAPNRGRPGSGSLSRGRGFAERIRILCRGRQRNEHQEKRSGNPTHPSGAEPFQCGAGPRVAFCGGPLVPGLGLVEVAGDADAVLPHRTQVEHRRRLAARRGDFP